MSDTFCPLLDLPPELRLRIWDLALPASPDECLFPALLQTCRLVRDEGTLFFHGRQRYAPPAPLDTAVDLETAEDEGETAEVSIAGANGGEKAEKVTDWREKVRVSAVECCEEGVVLSAPSFPFKQRWDAEYEGLRRWRKREAKRAARMGRWGGWGGEWQW